MMRRTAYFGPDHTRDDWWIAGGKIHYFDRNGAEAQVSEQQIHEEALAAIRQRPSGIRILELARALRRSHPEMPLGSIAAALSSLGHPEFAEHVARPERGLLAPAGADCPGLSPSGLASDYHAAVAQFLYVDAEDLTTVIPLDPRIADGSNWVTPDVLGVHRALPGDIFTWSPELLSVAVSTSTREAVIAFGQAAAYQVFSTKVYVGVPASISPSDRRELDVRCQHHGIGLLLLGPTPDAEHVLAIRARRGTPDLDATRQFLECLRRDRERFSQLFG
jgi:hypothetical protein